MRRSKLVNWDHNWNSTSMQILLVACKTATNTWKAYNDNISHDTDLKELMYAVKIIYNNLDKPVGDWFAR